MNILKTHDAWKRGQNPWVTVPNINTNETNKPFKKERANDLWGRPDIRYSMQAPKKVETNDE